MPIVSLSGVSKHFEPRWRSAESRQPVRAVDDVTLEVDEGNIHSIIGETGSGKTTIARLICGLLPATSGTITVDGIKVSAAKRRDLRQLRRRVQIVFQDPYASLNPRFNVLTSVTEPLRLNKVPYELSEIREALLRVGLTPPEEFMRRYPHELSGGQRQRVALARSLVLKPKLLVADEPVSMLDASMRASFLKVLAELHERSGLTMVLVSHDISIAYHFGGTISVLYRGRIVEEGTVDDVVNDPLHPYTKALIAAIPTLEKKAVKEVPIKGSITDAVAEGKGCRFSVRCPYAMPECTAAEPALAQVREGRRAACFLYK
ncbi:MAG TPA: ABC transporter ATP-binding protein [Thermoplasmata archaeon]|nr:ABC transporter ATP-binding protein [Thermoplasmata archaeon]